MPLQNYQYDKIMREYSKTQSRNRRLLEEHKQEIYAKIPRIREIDEEVATLSTQKARALLSGQASGTEAPESSNLSPVSGADCLTCMQFLS